MRKMEARGICGGGGGGGGGGAQARSFDEGPTHTLFLFCISPQVDEGGGGGGDEKEANEEEEEEEEKKVSHSAPQFPLPHGASSFERERKVRRRFPHSSNPLHFCPLSISQPPPPFFFLSVRPSDFLVWRRRSARFFGGGERTRPRSLWGKGVCV